MPLNSIPPTLDGPSFDAKRNALEGRSHADFALYGGLTPQSLDAMEELAARGVVGFKAFMVPSGVEEFRHADDLTLLRGMENAAALGLPVLLHAESAALTGALGEEARSRGETDAAAFARSRPIISELEAVSRALLYAEETGCAVHFVHLSNSRAVELVRRAVAERGLDATCETCPHYLFLTDEDAARTGPTAKCAPPLRPEAERARLVEALRAGRIDTVGSDHSPSPPSLKETDTFAAAWGGISGVQTTLRTLLTIGLELPAIAAVAADAPARRFGLAAKGRISPGYDADLTLIDPGAESVLTAEELHDRHRLSPYVGRRLRGRVERVFLRGRTVFRRGAAGGGALVEPPGGRLLTPSSRNGHSLV
jgi:allantoinase